MSVKKRTRNTIPAAERRLRSELKRLLDAEGLIRGTLARRERSCGKQNCRCMTRGEKHVSLYLVVSEAGKCRQIFVPRSLEDVVRNWVENYSKAKGLLEEISKLHHERLRSREV